MSPVSHVRRRHRQRGEQDPPRTFPPAPAAGRGGWYRYRVRHMAVLLGGVLALSHTAGASPQDSRQTPLENDGPRPVAEAVVETEEPSEPPEAAKHPCDRAPAPGETPIDEARRLLAETLCRANLWLDGLFGEDEHPEAARNAHGRAELSLWHGDYEGMKLGVRLNARIDLPNVEERLNAFFGRDDPDDFVQDRREGAALRSQMRSFERNESWLAGFGYSLPGDYRQRFDVRVGSRLSTAPKLFVQGRWRRNIEVGDATLWHLRQTVFWTNRDGFGTTSSVEYDRVLSPTMLFRVGVVGTVSERAEGLDWRSIALLFQNLPGPHAVALETFARGETRAEVPLRDYGGRVIYRRTLRRREWLFGEAFVGYSWPRRYLEESREGSLSLGVGLELLFGRD